MRIVFLSIFSFWCFNSFAQTGLIAHYSFDACDLSEETGLQGDGVGFGTLDCECGVLASSMEIGSGLDSINFPASITDVFTGDFTISFYVQLINPAPRVDILSFRNESCQVDSSLAIRYGDINKEFSVEIGEDFNDIIELYAPIDETRCWHHIVFSKSDRDYFLYYNGELSDQETSNSPLVIDPINTMSISNSACNGLLDDSFTGYIDELKIFNRFLSPLELLELNHFPDQIINQDTTIFLGDAIQILSGESCSQSPQWIPDTGVDNPNSLDPIITPPATAVYTLNLPGSNCSTSDSIKINVIDKDLLECGDLLLPNAFTPNGDNLNERFGISNEFIIEELDRFEIFDRWGESVFYTEDKNDSWDANFKGAKVNPAMFLYVVAYTCKGQKFTKTGSISVVR